MAAGRPRKSLNKTARASKLEKPQSSTITPVAKKRSSEGLLAGFYSTLAAFYKWINDRRFYIPLLFAVSLQSFTISVWVYFEFIKLFPIDSYMWIFVVVIACTAGLSLESVMIGTVYSTTEKTKNTSMATLFAAWLGSTWIALALFNTGSFFNYNEAGEFKGIAWDLKHAIWPTVISLYLLHRSQAEK